MTCTCYSCHMKTKTYTYTFVSDFATVIFTVDGTWETETEWDAAAASILEDTVIDPDAFYQDDVTSNDDE